MTTNYGVLRKGRRGQVLSPWLTAEEAALYCGRQSAEWVNEHVRTGELVADDQVGGKSLFRVETLDRFLRREGTSLSSSPSVPVSAADGAEDAENRRRYFLKERREVLDSNCPEGPHDGSPGGQNKDPAEGGENSGTGSPGESVDVRSRRLGGYLALYYGTPFT